MRSFSPAFLLSLWVAVSYCNQPGLAQAPVVSVLDQWVDDVQYLSSHGSWIHASLRVSPGRVALYRDQAGMHPVAVLSHGSHVDSVGARQRQTWHIIGGVTAAAGAVVAGSLLRSSRCLQRGPPVAAPVAMPVEGMVPTPSPPAIEGPCVLQTEKTWNNRERGIAWGGIAGGGAYALWKYWKPRYVSRITISAEQGQVHLRSRGGRRGHRTLANILRVALAGPAGNRPVSLYHQPRPIAAEPAVNRPAARPAVRPQPASKLREWLLGRD